MRRSSPRAAGSARYSHARRDVNRQVGENMKPVSNLLMSPRRGMRRAGDATAVHPNPQFITARASDAVVRGPCNPRPIGEFSLESKRDHGRTAGRRTILWIALTN